MRKGIVVGGSSGIGLAIAKKLMDKGYRIIIIDKCEPEKKLMGEYHNYEYRYTDLLNFNHGLFADLAKNNEIELLMITAGFGRAAAFEYVHPIEIEQLMQVNATAGLKIISYFYERLKSEDTFYCGEITSIAGLMSSPLFAVYAASKAAVCRFIESVNIELEVAGSNNRILNVSPASIPGTKFNGGLNEPSQVENLANDIVGKLLKKEELFIPKYEETFKAVLDRYHKDAHEYGIHSYYYKMQSGRVYNERRVKVGYLNPEEYNMELLKAVKKAKQKCDFLIVGIPNDINKAIDEQDAMYRELLESNQYVDRMIASSDNLAEDLKLLDIDIYFVYESNKNDVNMQISKFNKDIELEYIG